MQLIEKIVITGTYFQCAVPASEGGETTYSRFHEFPQVFVRPRVVAGPTAKARHWQRPKCLYEPLHMYNKRKVAGVRNCVNVIRNVPWYVWLGRYTMSTVQGICKGPKSMHNFVYESSRKPEEANCRGKQEKILFQLYRVCVGGMRRTKDGVCRKDQSWMKSVKN